MTANDSYDPLALLKAVLGESNSELVAGLLDLFLEDTPARIEALRSALEKRDSEAFRITGHELKRSAETIEAHSIAVLAERIEDLGRRGGWQGADFLTRRLEGEFVGLCRRLHVSLDNIPLGRTKIKPRKPRR